MKLSKVLSGLAGLTLTAASLTGCIIVDRDGDHDHVDYGGYGSLTVTTRINGSSDAWQCFDYDVEEIAVRVVDDAGFVVTEAVADCDALGLTLHDLAEGYYDVDVWLVDFFGDQMSDVVRVEDVDVLDGMDTQVDVDFPSWWIDP